MIDNITNSHKFSLNTTKTENKPSLEAYSAIITQTGAPIKYTFTTKMNEFIRSLMDTLQILENSVLKTQKAAEIFKEIVDICVTKFKVRSSYIFEYYQDSVFRLIASCPNLENEIDVRYTNEIKSIQNFLEHNFSSFIINKTISTDIDNSVDLWKISLNNNDHKYGIFLPIYDNISEVFYILALINDDKELFTDEFIASLQILIYHTGLLLRNAFLTKIIEERNSIDFSTNITENANETGGINREDASEELEALAYSISHDLRSPLQVIHNNCEWLESNCTEYINAEAHRILKQMIASIELMDKLLDGLLEFSKVVRIEPSWNPVDMTSLARTVSNELLEIEDNPGSISIHLKHLQKAIGDPLLIRQVWYNLLSNAFKFTRYRTKRNIEIGSFENKNEIVYYVSDNGVGFDMKYAKGLFNAFNRLHPVEEFEGTGVGLAIVKRIIKKHGGNIWAEAEIDKGAKFYFSLPINHKK